MQLISLLNDGQLHSSSEIATRLGISRSAVSAKLKSLTAFGLGISSVRGGGYRLENRVELLCADTILGTLARPAQALVSHLDILDEIDSTNLYLMRKAGMQVPGGYVCLAEFQHAGRGRQGHRWIAPYASNICLSLLWRFTTGTASLTGLSLAIGVALARALNEMGVSEIGLKWPNDVMWRGHKLAGILIDTGGQATGACHAVIGIGLNLSLPQYLLPRIDQAVTSLTDMVATQSVTPVPERNTLLAVILRELHGALLKFSSHGFAPFRAEWESCHAWHNQQARVLLSDGSSVAGIARGVNESGALILETAQGMQIFHAGEISLAAS